VKDDKESLPGGGRPAQVYQDKPKALQGPNVKDNNSIIPTTIRFDFKIMNFG
jgi:hypothetical protein